MQFKNPELLYALALLLIPIIVHLFQLRRFQKVFFTNVEFLKTVTKQTRKSQELKKWLTLITRLLLLACIIFAFAQPFTSETSGFSAESETVIYIDNSFSMQAKGDKGELLKRAVQDLLSFNNEDEELSIFTNDDTFRNVSLKSLRNDLLELNYSNTQLDYDAAIIKGKQLFRNTDNGIKNLVLISDFQQNRMLSQQTGDSIFNVQFVQLKPVNTTNISIDSAYIASSNSNNLELKVIIEENNNQIQNIPISLYNNDNLMAKTAIESNGQSEATFTLPNNELINGKLAIDDILLQFDNALYFNINEREKTNVLSINSAEDDFLERIFSSADFNYKAVAYDQLNYNEINDQNLIILNEIETLPQALINALNAFSRNEGYILIIPSTKSSLNSYNQLLNSISNINFNSLNPNGKRITGINYSHPLYKDVFDQEVTNFQYPKVNSFINTSSTSSPILQYEDGSPYLMQSGNTFVFTSALNAINSNVTNSPLIVPTLFNIGRQSFQLPQLYYTIGNTNEFDINTSLQQDDILKLRSGSLELIPQQQTYPKKVSISMKDDPKMDGIYAVLNSNEILERVSFNYDRSESVLNYHDLGLVSNVSVSDSIEEVINSIKSKTNINALWKWFVIFALIFLIIEMLILKYIR